MVTLPAWPRRRRAARRSTATCMCSWSSAAWPASPRGRPSPTSCRRAHLPEPRPVPAAQLAAGQGQRSLHCGVVLLPSSPSAHLLASCCSNAWRSTTAGCPAPHALYAQPPQTVHSNSDARKHSCALIKSTREAAGWSASQPQGQGLQQMRRHVAANNGYHGTRCLPSACACFTAQGSAAAHVCGPFPASNLRCRSWSATWPPSTAQQCGACCPGSYLQTPRRQTWPQPTPQAASWRPRPGLSAPNTSCGCTSSTRQCPHPRWAC